MRKFLLFILIFILGMSVYCNPKPGPSIHIVMLTIETKTQWSLSLLFEFKPDSLKIIISKDTILLSNYELHLDDYGIYTMYSEDFLDSIEINPAGDIIEILLDYNVLGTATLAFGDHPKSIIQAPVVGQSIVLDYYSYDNILGESRYYFYTIYDPTNGVLGTMKGTIYDVNLRPIINENLTLMGKHFSTNANGNYSVPIYAGRFSFTFVCNYLGKHVSIKEINVELYPGSIIERDIYLLEGINTSVLDIEKERSPIRFFPNPVSSFGKLCYEIDLPILSGNMSLHIFSIDGKLLQSQKVTDSSGEIQIAQPKGICRIVLKMDEKRIVTKSILIE